MDYAMEKKSQYWEAGKKSQEYTWENLSQGS